MWAIWQRADLCQTCSQLYPQRLWQCLGHGEYPSEWREICECALYPPCSIIIYFNFKTYSSCPLSIFSKLLKRLHINVGVRSISVALWGLKHCYFVHHCIPVPSSVPGIYMVRDRETSSRTNGVLSGPYSISQEWNFRGRNKRIINKDERKQYLSFLFLPLCSLLSYISWWSCGKVILEQGGAVSLEVQAKPVWNTGIGNQEQTSLFCLWSRASAEETIGSLKILHVRKPERDLGMKLPSKCDFAWSVFEYIVSEAWWGSWRLYWNLEFGDFDHSSLPLSIDNNSIWKPSVWTFWNIFFSQRMELSVGLINCIVRKRKPEQCKWKIWLIRYLSTLQKSCFQGKNIK